MGATSSKAFAIAITAVGGLLLGIVVALGVLLRSNRRSTNAGYNRDVESGTHNGSALPDIPLYGLGITWPADWNAVEQSKVSKVHDVGNGAKQFE